MDLPTRILIADDQTDVLEALRLLLKMEGFVVETATSPQAVLDAVGSTGFDLALIDLNYARDTTSGHEGLELLESLQSRDPSLPVVVMTAWASIQLAVDAMRRGAADFVTKPWDNAQLIITLRTHIKRRAGDDETRAMKSIGQRELQVARGVQARLLPQRAPHLPSLVCAARCEESGAVGGDFYDFLDLAPGHLGLVVADVSGKGVPAAIVMAHLSATLRSLAPQMRDDLVGLARKINELLFAATAANHYVTLFLAVYDERRRTLRYVNCGHLPPILLRAGGEEEWLSSTAPAVGLFEAFPAQQREVSLGPGDTLLVYSDGVTETTGRESDEFGAQRLLSFLRAHAHAEPELLVARLMEIRRAFASGDQRDDVTVLVAQGRERGVA